jgi:hypothetical protein
MMRLSEQTHDLKVPSACLLLIASSSSSLILFISLLLFLELRAIELIVGVRFERCYSDDLFETGE